MIDEVRQITRKAQAAKQEEKRLRMLKEDEIYDAFRDQYYVKVSEDIKADIFVAAEQGKTRSFTMFYKSDWTGLFRGDMEKWLLLHRLIADIGRDLEREGFAFEINGSAKVYGATYGGTWDITVQWAV